MLCQVLAEMCPGLRIRLGPDADLMDDLEVIYATCWPFSFLSYKLSTECLYFLCFS